MSPLRSTLVVSAALAAAIVAQAPVTVGLAMAGLGGRMTASETHGTLWAGRLDGAFLGSTPLGDVRANLSPVSLFTGRPAIDLAVRGGVADGSGRILLGGDSASVEAFTGTIPLDRLGAPAPFDGTLNLKAAGFAFARGGCHRAAGQASAEVRGLGDAPMTLTGRPVCQGAAVVLPLTGARDGVRVDITLRLGSTGRYVSEARVITADAALGGILSAAGFEKTPDGYGKTREGRLG